MITSLHTVQWFIHNLKTNKKGWGCTTKAEGHFIIAKLLNRLRSDSSSEILSSCLVSKLRCEVAGCDPSLPLTHKLAAGHWQDRFPVPLAELLSLFGFGESVWLCVNQEQRECPADCDSLLLWLTRVLTTTPSRHGDADFRTLAPVLAATVSVAKSVGSPLLCETRLG